MSAEVEKKAVLFVWTESDDQSSSLHLTNHVTNLINASEERPGEGNKRSLDPSPPPLGLDWHIVDEEKGGTSFVLCPAFESK